MAEWIDFKSLRARLSDGDEAGSRCTSSLFEALGDKRWFRRVGLAPRMQPTDYPADKVNQLLEV